MMAVAVGSRPEWEKIVHNEHVKRWLKQSKALRILVTGKTGVGKSALVNGIVGKYVAKEGHSIDKETSTVMEYCTEINGVEVIIYDSPGLQDGTTNEEAYLKHMEEKCQKVDLILYCNNMTDARFSEGDRAALSKFSKAFGVNNFWKNALLVLTFANEVRSPPQRSSDASSTRLPLHEYFEKRMKMWQTKFHEVLCDIGVKKDVAENVPIVPAGYHLEPSLPAVNCDYWLGNLWFECLQRTADTAKPALLKINSKRLRTLEEAKNEDFSKLQTHDQPIIINSSNIFKNIPLKLLQSVGTKGIESIVGLLLRELLGVELGHTAGPIIGELLFVIATNYLETIAD